MRPILVATNFSERSNNAVLYAASLAQVFNSKLILFNAFRLPVHAANSRLTVKSMDGLIKKNSDKLKDQALNLSKAFDIDVEYECKYVDLLKLSVKTSRGKQWALITSYEALDTLEIFSLPK